MCSVSFLPHDDGFILAMNRDESLSRQTALPPAKRTHGGRQAIYPTEPNGGTWIGINEAGLTFALINWYSRPQQFIRPLVSRGTIILKLLPISEASDVKPILGALPLERIHPFRLIVISPSEHVLCEWRSDGNQTENVALPWRKFHWFSSGRDEQTANEIRGTTCAAAECESDAGTHAWLRRLHRSHVPAKDAYSICMHRNDAQTVSYTEIVVRSCEATLSYQDGPPCAEALLHTTHLALRKP